jgi:hypothetical protein
MAFGGAGTMDNIITSVHGVYYFERVKPFIKSFSFFLILYLVQFSDTPRAYTRTIVTSVSA